MEPDEINAHVNMINEYLDHMERTKKQRINKAMFKNLPDLLDKLQSEYYLDKINDSKYNESLPDITLDHSVNDSFTPTIQYMQQFTGLQKKHSNIKIYLINQDLYRPEHLKPPKDISLSDLLSDWSEWTCDYIIEIVDVVIFRNMETEKHIMPIDPRTEEEKERDLETFLEIFNDLEFDSDSDPDDSNCEKEKND